MAVVVAVTLGCEVPAVSPTGNGQPKRGGALVAASWQEQTSLLAAGITDSAPQAIAYEAPMVEGLIGRTAGGSVLPAGKLSDHFQPQLATEVPTVENGDVKVSGSTMKVTYKLRQGVKWHDGKPFTSKDVADTANFYYLKYKEANPTPILSTNGWDQISSVDTPNANTAVVNFKSIYGPYLSLFSGPYGVLPSHLLQPTWAAGGDMTKTKISVDLSPANPSGFKGSGTWDKWLVGTGPFVFKEWVPGDHLTMVRNNSYWGRHTAYLDQITVKFEPDIETQYSDVRTETAQLGIDFRAGLLGPLGHVANLNTRVVRDSGSEKLDFNLKNKYLADPTIRKAINMSIDKQKMVDRLLQGRTSISPDTGICLGLAAWCSDASIPVTKYDRKAANNLLDAAGYKLRTVGPEAGFRAFSDGTTIALSLVTTAGNTLREQQEAQIASDLAAIGIKVKTPFKNPTAAQLFGSFAEGGVLYNHTFDMAQYANTVPGGDPDGWYGVFVCDQVPLATNGGLGLNDTLECNPALDAAFKAGRTTVAPAGRKQAYVAAANVLARDLPEVALYQQITVIAYNHRLNGYAPATDSWMNNSSEWYLNS